MLGFSTGGFLGEPLVADGNFTVDHMKMRCPEEDVNLTHGMDMWLKRAGTNSICLMHRSSKEVPSSQTLHLS